ncbi:MULTISPECIES: hypothetical protein [Streptomyces]|uniref:Uncharacterized protein n=1 Tax=Streptomyces thermoviolaceus subsp. thermoviolaceus TaxID=66860 RepID=A0ABX0Z2P7_STRTL|nr:MULTISPECIES: hypothetical protein [Streptomyces]MCM3266146.1 hypothetical protein [Streptomyces thermoviolaceus]NJP17535.1 hypothetical protein [Streptomyces thermoviolaceus subsp. thermoviolaceus]RSS01286.1 hypothetical protein EF917_15520 [Streptomyces sp. WAC00469]WTD49171.1 hypothetical protein OG899_17615 [Streptomyces thermoviolaceus]GGV80628.1 hypothetical protein GCM10010499_43910 [Streptomyces thermoviolaceus subsp. apingens]
MALYARVEKIEEDDRKARYKYTDIAGNERMMLLNKEAETTSAEDGVEDMLYRAVARKIAVEWARSGAAPDKLMVQS